MRLPLIAIAGILLASCTVIPRRMDASNEEDSSAATDTMVAVDSGILNDTTIPADDRVIPTVDAPENDVPGTRIGTISLPDRLTAELVYDLSELARIAESSQFDPSLPKLTGDRSGTYASVSYLTGNRTGGWSRIMRRRPVAGWTQAAEFQNMIQPVGIAMDRTRMLHAVLTCPANGVSPQNCFGPRVSSDAVVLRYHHLTFASQDAGVDFAQFGSITELTTLSSGYPSLHIFADRVATSVLGAVPSTRLGYYSTAREVAFTIQTPETVFLFPSSVEYLGTQLLFGTDVRLSMPPLIVSATVKAITGASSMDTRRVVSPVPGGIVNASDLDTGPRGSLYALARVGPESPAGCSQLIRATSLANIDTVPAGCVDVFAKLQIVDESSFVIFTSVPQPNTLRLGITIDRGAHWQWIDRSFTGTNPGETLSQWTLIDEQNAPLLYQPGLVKMLFCGLNNSGQCARVYYSQFSLQ